MALRKASETLQKITTNVFQSDWEWLQATYLKAGAGPALRSILRSHRQLTEQKIKDGLAKIVLDVELEE